MKLFQGLDVELLTEAVCCFQACGNVFFIENLTQEECLQLKAAQKTTNTLTPILIKSLTNYRALDMLIREKMMLMFLKKILIKNQAAYFFAALTAPEREKIRITLDFCFDRLRRASKGYAPI